MLRFSLLFCLILYGNSTYFTYIKRARIKKVTLKIPEMLKIIHGKIRRNKFRDKKEINRNSKKKKRELWRALVDGGLNTLFDLNKSKVSFTCQRSETGDEGTGLTAEHRLDSLPFYIPLMKHFHLAARKLCVWPSPVTSSNILSSVWGERARTPLQGKLIFTEDAVHRCTNLHEIWLPFINQDEYAPVHQRCLPSEFVVFPACWLEANSINHTAIHDLT